MQHEAAKKYPGCPLLATDRIITARASKDIPVPGPDVPAWKHQFRMWFRKHVYLRFNQFCWKKMGMIPIDDPRSPRHTEGFQSFTSRGDAEAFMRTKGPGWYLEETPLNGCLPDEACTFGDTDFPIGETMYSNGSSALPTAMPSSIATLQRGIAHLNHTLSAGRNIG